MARLEWKNVAAPSFAGIAENYRTMSDLLGRAAGSTQGMFDIFANAQQNAADQAIMQRMLGATDAATFDPTAILGADGNRASMGMLQNLNRHADTLINRDGARLGQQVTRDNHNWTQQGREQILQFSEPMRRALAAAGSGDTTALSGDAFTGMRADVYGDFQRDALSAATSDMGLRTSRQRLDESVHNFDRQKRTEGLTDELARATAYLARHSTDPVHAEQLLWEQNFSPEVINQIRNGIGNFGAGPSTGLGGAGGTGTGTSTGGTDFTRIVNYEGRASGIPSVPESVRTLGDAANFARQINDANRQRTGKAGSSAMGLYQIVGSTLRSYAPKVFGEDWESMAFSPHAQDALAEAIFNDNKGSAEALRKQWVSLSPAEAERVRQMPWSQARLVIAQKESGASPHDMQRIFGGPVDPLQRSNALADLTRADTVANANSLNRRLAALEGQPETDITTLTKKLIENGFTGYTQGELADVIRDIKSEGDLTNDQAALVLQEGIAAQSGGMRLLDNAAAFLNQFPILNWFVPDGRIAPNTFDRSRLTETARAYREGGIATQDQNAERSLAAQRLAQAAAQVDALTAALEAARLRFEVTRSPEVAARIQQIQAQLDAAQQIEEVLTRRNENDPLTSTRAENDAAARAAELLAASSAGPPQRPAPTREDILFRGGFR